MGKSHRKGATRPVGSADVRHPPGAGADTERRASSSVAFPLAFAFLMGFFFAASVHGVREERELRRLSIESAQWVPVAGWIQSSSVTVTRTSKRTTYSPDIEYTYTVNDRVYRGTRVSFVSGYSESSANALVERYRPFHPVSVWVPRGAPTTAVLEPQSWDDRSALVVETVASGLFALGLLGAIARVVFVVSARGKRAWSREKTSLVDVLVDGAIEAPDDGALPAPPPRPLGDLVEATDDRLVFVAPRRGPDWRLGAAAVGALLGPAVAPLASTSWWWMTIVIVVPAASLALAYFAMPEVALALSTAAPLRTRLVVARTDVDGYRGEPLYTAVVDGRTLGPDPRRALFDLRGDHLVACVLVIGAKAAVLAYATGRSASPTRAPGVPMRALADALARVLHAPKTAVRAKGRPLRVSPWALLPWLGARAAIYVVVARNAPLDPHVGIVVGLGSAFALLAIEAAIYRLAVGVSFRPRVEALVQALRERAQD